MTCLKDRGKPAATAATPNRIHSKCYTFETLVGWPRAAVPGEQLRPEKLAAAEGVSSSILATTDRKQFTVGSLNKNHPSDGSLVRSIRNGDQFAAQDLFQRYIEKLDRLAGRQMSGELSGRLDSEDITQSVFRTFFRRIGQGQYELPPGETIWKLLAVIALNKIRTTGTHHRAAKRDIRKTASVHDLQSLGNAVTQDEDALRVLHITIEELVGTLPEVQQQIIQLRLEEHEVAAIAERVRRSKRTVERVLHGFRADLQRAIDREPS